MISPASSLGPILPVVGVVGSPFTRLPGSARIRRTVTLSPGSLLGGPWAGEHHMGPSLLGASDRKLLASEIRVLFVLSCPWRLSSLGLRSGPIGASTLSGCVSVV